MWEISAEITLAARHQIRGVPGEGGRVHDHRWTVRALVRAERLDATGWVLDFHAVERWLEEIVAPYRGAFLNDIAPWDDVNPTRENLARVIADRLAAKVDDGRARLARVDVAEGGCCASYVR
ncbi:MAG TPA: 6-carboxytetrahydropterin synthase [Polyangiaceae bacterium]